MNRERTDIESRRVVTRYLIACAVAYGLLRYGGVLTNAFLYPSLASGFGLAREVATGVGALMNLLIALISFYRPQLLRTRVLAGLAIGFSIMALACALAGCSNGSFVLLAASAVCRAAGQALCYVLLAFCLFNLENPKQVALAIAFGLLVTCALSAMKPLVSGLAVAATISALIPVAVALWALPAARELLSVVRAGDPVIDLKLADPNAFIPVSHSFFVCALLFSAASGFALSFNEVDAAPIPLRLEAPLIVMLLAYVGMARSRKREDSLFALSFMLVIAGYLATPFSFETSYTATSGTLLRFGSECFEVLIWTSLVQIGRRNVYGFISSVGVARLFMNVGTIVGVTLGRLTNGFGGDGVFMATVFANAMVFAFFCFLWCGFRTFSFTDTIQGVTTVSHPVSEGDVQGEALLAGEAPVGGEAPENPVEQAKQHDAAMDIDERCARISKERGLTPRESEIFVMMAHGRNGRYVQDYYTISRNTAKSHIKHIYTKLDVHSHQELIDLAEGKQVSDSE
ncbi:MAG: helix-turn-helix transcriptional regulator [Eggerthellaceae bacterium]|jgi:DNA-binding CsgD family transcriptional regulator